MLKLSYSTLGNYSFNQKWLFKSSTILMCSVIFTSCWYTGISKGFIDKDQKKNQLYEWKLSTTISAYFRTDKKVFVTKYGVPPEQYHKYYIDLTLFTITEVDTGLSLSERHEIKIDSVKIQFDNCSKIFLVENTFDDNQRNKKFGHVTLDYLKAWTEINIGSITIPSGIQAIKITTYGLLKSQQEGLEPFELTSIKIFEELSERISKYD